MFACLPKCILCCSFDVSHNTAASDCSGRLRIDRCCCTSADRSRDQT